MAVPKMGTRWTTGPWFSHVDKCRPISILGVNCPITASGYEVPSSLPGCFLQLAVGYTFGPEAATLSLVLRLEKDCFV